MKRWKIPAVAVASALMISSAFADGGDKIKTRLNHFTGTKYVLVISYLPDEITSISCDSWSMLGLDSWKGHNNFTIPAVNNGAIAAVGVLDASGFDGYCKNQDSIVAHTDSGDFVGHLDRGAGNWSASTKLIFNK